MEGLGPDVGLDAVFQRDVAADFHQGGQLFYCSRCSRHFLEQNMNHNSASFSCKMMVSAANCSRNAAQVSHAAIIMQQYYIQDSGFKIKSGNRLGFKMLNIELSKILRIER